MTLSLRQRPAVLEAPRILVVDDEAAIRRILQRVLQREGYAVSTAETGEEAIRRLAEWKPNLVFLDLNLPDCHGAELALRFQADGGRQAPTIVAVTGDFDVVVEGTVATCGKPFRVAEIVRLAARYT